MFQYGGGLLFQGLILQRCIRSAPFLGSRSTQHVKGQVLLRSHSPHLLHQSRLSSYRLCGVTQKYPSLTFSCIPDRSFPSSTVTFKLYPGMSPFYTGWISLQNSTPKCCPGFGMGSYTEPKTSTSRQTLPDARAPRPGQCQEDERESFYVHTALSRVKRAQRSRPCRKIRASSHGQPPAVRSLAPGNQVKRRRVWRTVRTTVPERASFGTGMSSICFARSKRKHSTDDEGELARHPTNAG